MRGFEANDCRLCNKTFCCPKCRLKHEINIHKIFPGCNLCIYGQSECDDIIKETQLEHLENTHLPLNCIYCRRVFAFVEEIRQHRKCPVLQKRDDLPNTPFKEATIGEADEEAQDSPILQELQRNELLSYKFDLATSTPMPRVQEPVIFDKNRISDIQFDTEKSIPVINKSIIRKTDSRVDSIKDEDHSSKRRVTFVETPGNIKNMDSEGREDKRDINTPDYSKGKTSCWPVTPATGIAPDQFYSAQSELEDFLPSRATGFLRHRPPAEGFTPVGVSFLSKVISGKGNINASSDYHAPNKLEEKHGVPTTPKDEDINTDEVPLDITCADEEAGKIIITEASIVRNSNKTDEHRESSQADQHTSSEKIMSNSSKTSATEIDIDKFDTANSDFNKVSSTPGFIRRRGPLSERFAQVEVPINQSTVIDQKNINALSDLDAPNKSMQKTFSASTSIDENLNTTGPNEVSMISDCSWEPGKFEPIKMCSPLSSSKSFSTSPRTKISEQSKKGDANLSIPDSEGREDKRDNTPDYSKGKTSCSPVTPATGIRPDQFYSARSELGDFLPSRATGFSRHRPPAEGLTPVRVSFLSKIIPAKENISASSDYHVPIKLEEGHGVATTPKVEDINTDVESLDITCADVSDSFLSKSIPPKENINASSDYLNVPTIPKDEDINTDEVSMDITCTDEDVCTIIPEASVIRNSNKADEQCESSQAGQHTSSKKITSNSSETSATEIEIDKFDTANSDSNKVSSTPGFIRRRGPLTDRFAPEVPQIQSNVTAQENINALSDLDAPNVSLQKTFSANTSKEENLNTSCPMKSDCSWEPGKLEPIEVCSPLSASNATSSSLPTRIREQSKKGDANLYITVEVPQIQSNVTAQENIHTMSDLDAPNVSLQNSFSAATSKDENLNTSGPNEVSVKSDCIWEPEKLEAIEMCSPLSASNSCKSPSSSPPTRISEQSKKVDANLSIPGFKENENCKSDANKADQYNPPVAPVDVHNQMKITMVESIIEDTNVAIHDTQSEDISRSRDFSCASSSVDCHLSGEKKSTPLPPYHTAARPYTCDFCSRRFRMKANLNNHMVAHHYSRPYICNLCDAKYTKKDDLLNHLKSQTHVPDEVTMHGSENNNVKCESSKVDQHLHEGVDGNEQMNDFSFKTLRLKSPGILDDLNNTENDEPPNIKVPSQNNQESLHAPAKSSKLSSNDRTHCHNTKETKIPTTTESSQPRATTSMQTPVFKKTDVCISFNFPNHCSSTPIKYKSVKIKQINITDEVSKIPKDLLSSKSNTLSLPNNYSSEETNECKDLAICDSKPESNESSEGFVTVSSMTDLSLWTSMTRIFQTVFGGLHSRSKDNFMDTSSSNLKQNSFKRTLSESDSDTNYYSSPPHVKRYKFSNIKCRRPIREPMELPFRVALMRAESSDRVSTSGFARTVYEAGPKCKILWDKATQTDDYLMDGWHPQLK